MSTIANAVQAMVNNLTTKMTSGTPFTPEEQLLVAKALSALQDNETWEKAVVAVVEEHLSTGTTALAAAKAQLDTSLQEGVNAMTTAEASLLAKSAQLDIAASVPGALSAYAKTKDGLIGNMSDMLTVIPESELMKDSGYGVSPPITNMIFCSNGDVYAHTVPTGKAAGSGAGIKECHNFYGKLANLNPKNGVFTRLNYCHYSSDSARSAWSQRYAYDPACAFLPLASSVNGDVTFCQLISDFNGAANSESGFRGIGLFYNSNYGVVTGHYHNANIKDKYGRKASTLGVKYRYSQSYFECGLYDNVKNCLVVIQDYNVWELYSNGWVNAGVPTFGTDAQAQAWVNAQPDMFLVPFVSLSNDTLFSPLRHDAEGPFKTRVATENSYDALAQNVLNRCRPSQDAVANTAWKASPVGYLSSVWGSYDSASNYGTSTGYQVSQQYLWDAEAKKLSPVLRESFYEIVPGQLRDYNATTTTISYWSAVKQRTVITNLATKQKIGEAQQIHQVREDGTHRGVVSAGIPFYNPYDGVWYQAQSAYISDAYHTGICRLELFSDSLKKYIGQ